MYRVNATLPMLGTVPVDFHDESEVVTEFMGQKEWDRLRSVPHLGVAASVFTGVHHSRLEYVLLQCAVTWLVGKVHRNDEQFALSNKVALNGLKNPISSGEELIKIWILLSNYGHAQHTYGVERALLQQATEISEIRDWLVGAIARRDLRKWATALIEEHRYTDFRYILTLLRISLLPRRDRRKNRFAHYLRNLLLPLSELFPSDPVSRYKLGRLRDLFARIRLLSMVALDAHYSHQPISMNLTSAIVSLAELLPSASRGTGFNQFLNATSGWQADELYLHPLAVAAQREYELRFAAKFPKRFLEATRESRLPTLLHELMTQGLGPPRPAKLLHVVRISLPAPTRRQLLGSSNIYETTKQLQKDLVDPPKSYLSVDTNTVTRIVHIDLFLRRDAISIRNVTRIYTRLQKWLVRNLEADSLARIRRLYSGISKVEVQKAKERDFYRQLDRYSELILSFFNSVIRSYVPLDRSGVIAEFRPIRRSSVPVSVSFALSDGTVIDTITPRIRQILDENPDAQPVERLQEIRCLEQVCQPSNGKFLMVCLEKFVIKDQHGKHVDDWDGIAISISESQLILTIVEGKTGGSARQREDAAFRQLDATRRIVVSRHSLRYRRQRIDGLGAAIHFAANA